MIVKYSNNTIKEYETFEQISDGEIVISIDCSKNELTQLPENMNFPNLQELNCSNNQLTQLPENMNLPNLQKLDCSNNQLIVLFGRIAKAYTAPPIAKAYTAPPIAYTAPPIAKAYTDPPIAKAYTDPPIAKAYTAPPIAKAYTAPPIAKAYTDPPICFQPELTHLHVNMNLPNLQALYCSSNQLTQLPENMNFPNLQFFHYSNNKLTQLPENMNFPKLRELDCSNNKLTSLSLCILNFRHLQKINYVNNEIELSPQIARFIHRMQNRNLNNLNVYNDTQNIHNVNIQVSVKDSINNITTRTDLPKFNQDKLIDYILKDDALLNKEQLIEYSNDMNVHSLLLLTFAEVLWFTLQTIIKDFDGDIQQEIKTILNQEMDDAECKCFTGRINRIINCLNGFSPLVSINISDNEQIGNIIVIIKEKLELTNSYTIETHKELVINELENRGYTKDIIDTWIGFIE